MRHIQLLTRPYVVTYIAPKRTGFIGYKNNVRCPIELGHNNKFYAAKAKDMKDDNTITFIFNYDIGLVWIGAPPKNIFRIDSAGNVYSDAIKSFNKKNDNVCHVSF